MVDRECGKIRELVRKDSKLYCQVHRSLPVTTLILMLADRDISELFDNDCNVA